ncbi:MAG: tRNA (adenosine(37)-N6)-threonylcarbamoyltransferase complex dimerization subunit type 1 TsaB [Pseudomonadota bacterium]
MILAINTSTIQFSIALLNKEGDVLTECLMCPTPGHFGAFMPTLDSLLTLSKTNLKDVEAIIVAIGPGSFTGLRIGLSAAKGMAHSLNIPVIGVSGLEAMTNQVTYSPFPICPILESRKGDVFIALFRWKDDQKIMRIKEDTCLKVADISSYIDETALFLGSNFKQQGPMISKMLGAKARLAPPHLWNLRASAVGISGLRRFLNGDFDDLQALAPCYLLPPDIGPSPFGLKSKKMGHPV